MRNGYKVTLSIITIMIMLTLTVGTSYSFYTISAPQTESNNITTSCFKPKFDDTGATAIGLNKTYPMNWDRAKNEVNPYTFKISNECLSTEANEPIKYVITLSTLNNPKSLLSSSYLSYRVNETGETTKLTAKPYELDPSIKTQYNIEKTYELGRGTIDPRQEKEVSIYLWLDEDAQNDAMSKRFEGRIIVYYYM